MAAFEEIFFKATIKSLQNAPPLSAPLLPVGEEADNFKYSQELSVKYWKEFLIEEQGAEILKFQFGSVFGITVERVEPQVVCDFYVFVLMIMIIIKNL
jgi:hypothetical protein